MHMNKTFIITGGTGDLGSSFAKKMLAKGHTVYIPVRSLEKAQRIFENQQGVYYEVVNLEDAHEVMMYLKNLSVQGVVPTDIALFAGDLKKDHKFPGETKEEKERESVAYHRRVNVLTAQTVIAGVRGVYPEILSSITLVGISSWAARFEPGHPYRVDEEGYVIAKAELSSMLSDLKKEGVFKDVVCEEPAFIISTITTREFPELISDPSVKKMTPEEYTEHLVAVLDL